MTLFFEFECSNCTFNHDFSCVIVMDDMMPAYVMTQLFPITFLLTTTLSFVFVNIFVDYVRK